MASKWHSFAKSIFSFTFIPFKSDILNPNFILTPLFLINYPFRAPLVRPSSNFFWKNKINKIKGTTDITMAADIVPHGNSYSPGYIIIPTGRVCFFGSDIKVKAYKNSFQLYTKTKMAPADKAGVDKGSITLTNA